MVEKNHMQARVIYLPVLIMWLLFLLIVMSGIIQSDLNSAKQRFIDSINSHYKQASDRARTNDTVVEGFAALVSTMQELDQQVIRKYARQILNHYPHIFRFEITETVPFEKLETFSRHYRNTVDPDFKIKAFTYETDRKLKPIEKQALYMPIVFMEPFPPESREVLGLDLYSHDFFSRSLKKYSQYKHSVITEPFKLVEGNLAYLIHKPVSINKINAETEMIQRSVMLVITADTLLSREHQPASGMTELLHHPDFSPADEKGYLHLHRGPVRSKLESLIFPCYTNSITLENKSQPFVLINKYQLGWDTLSWYQLISTLLVGIISFAVLMIYARIYHKDEVKRLQTAKKWFHMANHDALTGLANRYLLLDRLNHALYQAKRLDVSLAVIFIDLNDFKIINDTYGHDAGDNLLQHFAERLRANMRVGDTIARYGGDEFVLLIESMTSIDEINQIILKLRQATESSFFIHGHTINLNLSIGFSIYPDDGKDIDSLINQADTRMYQDKETAKINQAETPSTLN